MISGLLLTASSTENLLIEKRSSCLGFEHVRHQYLDIRYAAASFVSEIRHAPNPLRPLFSLHPLFHILGDGFEVAQPRPVGHGSGEACRASEWVDPDLRPEVHAHRSLVPLAGQPLRLLLLLQLIQSLQEDGSEVAGHLVYLWLVGLYNIPKPVKRNGETRHFIYTFSDTQFVYSIFYLHY